MSTIYWKDKVQDNRMKLTKTVNRSRFVSYQLYENKSDDFLIPKDPIIIFTLTGKLEYQIGDDELRTLEGSEYLYCPKGVSVKLEAEKNTCIAILHIKKELVERFIENLKSYSSIQIPSPEKAIRVCIFQQTVNHKINSLLKQLFEQYFVQETDHDFFLSMTLLQLMYHIFPDEHMLSKIIYLIETPYYPEAIMKLESYMLENYSQPIRIKQMVNIVSISESQLNRLYKKHFHMSPMERLTAIRMEQAALLLRNPSITITETAGQVGYQSMSAFVEKFKRKFGMSPKEFQKQNRR